MISGFPCKNQLAKFLHPANTMKFLVAVSAIAAFSAVTAQSNLIQAEGSDGCSQSEENSEEVEKIIDECTAEVESAMLLGLDRTMQKGLAPFRRKRETVITPAERRMNGCILQCIFKKYNILEEDGIPTRRGLLSVVTDGVTDRGFLMAASQYVDKCYEKYRQFRYEIIRNGQLSGGLYCDVAFDAFQCFLDEIDQYCDSKK